MNRPLIITAGFAALAAALLTFDADAAPSPIAPEGSSDMHRLADVTSWSRLLAQGAVVRYQHQVCDQERAALEQRGGEPVPDIYQVDELKTFGPLPDATAQTLARYFHESSLSQIAEAEAVGVVDIITAREQASCLLSGLKAGAAARAILSGDYWTIEGNTHPRLPEGWSYYAAMTDEKGPDGERLDIFVPLDLHAPELRTAHAAMISLENELRRERADEFNRRPWDDRQSIVDRAALVVKGEHVDPPLPEYFWRLAIDRRTLLASPRLRAE